MYYIQQIKFIVIMIIKTLENVDEESSSFNFSVSLSPFIALTVCVCVLGISNQRAREKIATGDEKQMKICTQHSQMAIEKPLSESRNYYFIQFTNNK